MAIWEVFISRKSCETCQKTVKSAKFVLVLVVVSGRFNKLRIINGFKRTFRFI